MAAQRRRYERRLRLQRLGYRDYPAYLSSAHWARTKARYRASDQPQECICGETEHLQLHHLTYDRVGAEELTDLTPLCGDCHRMIHVLERRGEIGLDFTGFVNEQRAERRRLEVEATVTERHLSWLQGLAAMEDLRRDVQAITRMPGANQLLDYDLHQAIGIFKQAERKLWARTAAHR